MNKNEALAGSAIGLVALFLILVAANYILSTAAVRVDLTEGKLYTLSEGTRRILTGLSSPVKVKLYVSQGESIPVQMRGFAQRVEDTVEEFRAASGGKLIVERYHPKPDSDEEDAAQLDGIEPQQLFSGEQFYLGIAVSQLERKFAIPAISPQRERLLEYDLAKAVARVGIAERPKIGLMAGLPVMGQKLNPFTRQAAEPWVLANELKRDFEVKEIAPTAERIDADVNVLLLIHPAGITPQTEYALDQFVLRGGKLIAFVDPFAFFDQRPSPPGMPPQTTSSTLPTLFKAWGIRMDETKVVSDLVFASGGGQRYTPTVLTLNRTAFDRDDVVTGQIENILYPFGGAFDVTPVEGLSAQPLMRTSPNSMLVESSSATASGDAATKNFKPAGRAMPLALRLSGTFRTAFAQGRPAAAGADKDATKPAPKPAAEAHLTSGAKPNSVVLVADVDLLADGAAVDIQEVLGRRIVVPSNGNLAFALGLVEQLTSGDELTSLRSRTTAFRPLTRVRELETEAAQQYFGKIRTLEEELQKTTEKLQALQSQRSTAGKSGAQILTPQEQDELDRFRKRVAETRRELKDVRKTLRRDAERLVFMTKLVNILLVPVLVALAGIGVALTRTRRAQRAAAGTA